jgi:uncharacterized protein YegL
VGNDIQTAEQTLIHRIVIAHQEATMPQVLELAEAVEFAENPEPRCPCVLLLDTSSSMRGAPIAALNEGLQRFKQDLEQDTLAVRRVEIATVSFDSNVQVVNDFITVDRFAPPMLTAQGHTHMGTAIHQALDMLHRRKEQYRTSGVAYYRPWVFMITDGEPQGEPDEVVARAAQRVKDEEAQKRLAFFAVGVENANMARLQEIAERTPIKLSGLNFDDMFVWLSASMQAVAQSRPDEQLALPPPDWGTL